MADPTIPTSNSSTSGGAPVSNAGGRTVRRGFDGLSNYTVSEFSYPTDLFTSSQGSQTADPNTSVGNNAYNSYIVFYINVTQESRVSKSGGDIIVGTVDRADQNSLQFGSQGSLGEFGATAASAGAQVGTVLGVPGAASSAGRALMQPGTAKARIGRAAGAAGVDLASAGLTGGAVAFAQTGALTAALSQVGIKASTKINRLKTAIAMHVPQNYVVGYRINYADEELGAIFGNAAAAARGQNVSGTQAAIVGLASRSDAMPAISALTRSAINPRREQLFRSVDNRRFTFEYQFKCNK
jgi:hypothetical protein